MWTSSNRRRKTPLKIKAPPIPSRAKMGNDSWLPLLEVGRGEWIPVSHETFAILLAVIAGLNLSSLATGEWEIRAKEFVIGI